MLHLDGVGCNILPVTPANGKGASRSPPRLIGQRGPQARAGETVHSEASLPRKGLDCRYAVRITYGEVSAKMAFEIPIPSKGETS